MSFNWDSFVIGIICGIVLYFLEKSMRRKR
jgi:hypothetical protein